MTPRRSSTRHTAQLLRRVCCLLAVLAGAVALAATTPEVSSEEPAPSAIAWKAFHPAAFRRATAEDRPVLLVLDVPWSEAVAMADDQLWADPEIAAIIEDGFVPIRERADLRPDLARRYPAEGWPAVSVLLPDGRPLVYQSESSEARRRITSGLIPASSLKELLNSSIDYYKSAKQRAISASRTQSDEMRRTAVPTAGAISETMVWGIAQSLRSTFDPEHRYFGGPPRIPRFDLIELSLELSGEFESPWLLTGSSALDTLGSKLTDPESGGMYRMALGLDWEQPQREQILDRNARYLELLTLAYRLTGKKSVLDRARSVAGFMMTRLDAGDGAFGNAVCKACPDGRDMTVLSGPNAQAAVAMMHAGAVFDAPELASRGLDAAQFLRSRRYRPGRGVVRVVVDGVAAPPGTLVLDDQVETARAFVTAYELTGDRAWLRAAEDVARTTLANFKSDKTAALMDIIPHRNAPVPLSFGLYPLRDNSEMVRLLVRLAYLLDSRDFIDAARGILSSFASSYESSPLQSDSYGLAAYEFHFPPMTVHVVARPGDPRADLLRQAGLSSPFPFAVVRTWNADDEQAAIRSMGFTIVPEAGLYLFHSGMGSTRYSDPGGVSAAIHELRKKVVVRDRARREQAGESTEAPR